MSDSDNWSVNFGRTDYAWTVTYQSADNTFLFSIEPGEDPKTLFLHCWPSIDHKDALEPDEAHRVSAEKAFPRVRDFLVSRGYRVEIFDNRPKPPEFPRPLTERERTVTRWLIAHGDCSDDEKRRFISHLADAQVCGRCPCGCASVDFVIGNCAPPKGKGMRLIGDFLCGGGKCGIFAFTLHDLLAGVEIYTLADDAVPSVLPDPTGFVSFPKRTP